MALDSKTLNATATLRRHAPVPFADRERANPYFRWLMHFGLPAVISVFAHLVILPVLALYTWYSAPASTLPEDIEVGLTDATLDRIAGVLQWPTGDPIEIADPTTPEVNPFDFTNLRDLTDLTELSKDPPVNPGELGDGGFGVGDSGRSGILGLGAGAGRGGGGGRGTGFGSGTGVPDARVFNLAAAGSKFAYVVDFSGSIIVAVDDLKRELRRSIGELRAQHQFNVVIFYSAHGDQGEVFKTETFSGALIEASPENKRRFFGWIAGRNPVGSTEPLAAVKRALSLKPDAVFLFSDGYFDDSVVGEIAEANSSVKAQIHCLVFDETLLESRDDMPRMTDGARRLKRIADASGGQFRIVTGADLAN